MTAPDSWPSPATPYTPASYAPAPPRSRPSPLAWVAFLAGAATVLLAAAFTLFLPIVVSSGTTVLTTLAAVQAIHAVLSAVLGLVAVITGWFVLARRGAGTALAAAGTALGGAALLHVVVGLVQGLAFQVL